MDYTDRMRALTMAKTLISSHGLTTHMSKHSRDMLAREVRQDSAGFRYEFLIDPTRDSWAASNPGCSLAVTYDPDPKGSRFDEAGAMVIDHTLRIGVSMSGNDMTVEVMRKREQMVVLVGMLCDMLVASLPKTVTILMETPEQVIDARRRAEEQVIGEQIMKNVGVGVLKGLRRGGTPRHVRLTEAYMSKDGDYPKTGTYRYRFVRSTDGRGRPREVVHYLMKVYPCGVGNPPSVTIQRVDLGTG